MHGVIVGSRHPSRAARRQVKRRRHSATQLARGLDSAGRFIGQHDFERGWQHFWLAPHRRSSAPLVRSDPVFGRDGRPGNSGAKGVPRPMRSGLDFAKLRAIHARRQQGESTPALAAAFGVHYSTIKFHLKPSASMRAALAAVPAPASAAA